MNKDFEMYNFCIYLNNVIENAVHHGGDVGGPYYSDKESLTKAMKRLLKWLDIYDGKVLIDEDGYVPKFYVKRCD